MAPLTDYAFMMDTKEVHIYLIKFITGNHVAETKVQSLLAHNDGRQDFTALKQHYEGANINLFDVIKSRPYF